jgi:hypothetical protein
MRRSASDADNAGRFKSDFRRSGAAADLHCKKARSNADQDKMSNHQSSTSDKTGADPRTSTDQMPLGKIGFVGLGLMGGAMAANLAAAGYAVNAGRGTPGVRGDTNPALAGPLRLPDHLQHAARR